MTNKEITTLVRKTVANSLNDFFSDPDLGKEVKKSFIRSLERARNEKGKSMTLAQVRKQYGF